MGGSGRDPIGTGERRHQVARERTSSHHTHIWTYFHHGLNEYVHSFRTELPTQGNGEVEFLGATIAGSRGILDGPYVQPFSPTRVAIALAYQLFSGAIAT